MPRQMFLSPQSNTANAARNRVNRAQFGTPPVSLHLRALRRGLLFAAALISLVAPMAMAARHAEAELTLARSWPLDLSAGRRPGVTFPAAGAED